MRRFLALFAVLMLSGVFATAQDHSVKGHVTGPDGNSLPGITVQLKGSSKTGVATDAAGEYTITVPVNSTLLFSGVGFKEQSVQVGNRSTVDVSLESSTQKLNEVVVTALGIKRQERAIGYSAQKVDNSLLTESKPTTIGEGLTGKVSGMQINTINNGVDPGIRIVLRGYRHLNADNQALIVVDGVAVRSNFLSSLNPNDIDNVTILKGASAAALYGVDATNGVLVVTTKRGSKNGKPRIEFNNTTMFESVSYMPTLQNKFAPGSSETSPFPWDPNHVFTNPYTGQIQYVPYENQNYGIEFNGDTSFAYIGGPGPDGSYFKTPFRGINPDPRRAFFQTGNRIQNNLSYSGGDNLNSYFLSVQDVSTKGTVPKDQGRRTSIYVSGKKTYGIFSAQFSLSYAQRYSNVVGPDFNQARPVYWNLLNQGANVPLNDPRLKDPNSPYLLDQYYNGYYPNPWWQIYNSRIIQRTNYFNGVLTLNLQAAKWLDFTYRAGTNYTTYNDNSYVAAVNFSPWAVSDPWQAGNIASSVGLHKNGSSSYTTGNARAISQDVLATLHKKFNNLDATFVLGNTIGEKPYGNNYSAYTNISSSQEFIDGFYNTSYRIGELSGNQGISNTRLVSGYADLTLGYDNWVFLHGSFRRDWSSLLPKGHNAYNFYSVDGSWIFTDAIASLKSQDIINYGKLHAAYSHTGQITIGPYNFTNVFDVADGYPYGGQAGVGLNGSYRNPNLLPEQTDEKEVGLEMGFLSSRINLDVTYYNTITSGQTFPVNISNTSGFSSAYVNAGKVESKGLEVGLNATVIRNNISGFKWDVGLNYTWNGSKVLSMYKDVKDFSIGYYNHAVVGQPFPVLEVNDLQRDPATGRIVIDPKTGYPKLVDTLNNVGRSTPSDMFNVSTGITWKHFTFNALASYRTGNQFYAFVGSQLDFTGASQHTALNNRQRFIFPNSVYLENGKYITNDKYYVKDGARNFWTTSDYTRAGTTYIEDGSFWKLRTVSLSYDFTSMLQNVKWIHGLNLTVIGKNLLMWRPSQNLWTDPEFNVDNVNAQSVSDYNQLPPTRQYGVSLDVKF